jgi:hypothetical protein
MEGLENLHLVLLGAALHATRGVVQERRASSRVGLAIEPVTVNINVAIKHKRSRCQNFLGLVEVHRVISGSWVWVSVNDGLELLARAKEIFSLTSRSFISGKGCIDSLWMFCATKITPLSSFSVD